MVIDESINVLSELFDRAERRGGQRFYPTRLENQIRLSHEVRIGVKWNWTRGWRPNQRSFLGLWALRLFERPRRAFGERFDPRRHHRRPDVRSSSGDGQTSQKLLAPEYDERHNSHRQAAPETCLLDDPDMGCLEQFGRED